MKLYGVLVATTITFLATPLVSQPLGDVGRGEDLANRWCSSCHVVEQTGTDLAPSFGSIAMHPDISDANIRDWLIDPHVNMPPFDLSEDEIRDIIAYIDTFSMQ